MDYLGAIALLFGAILVILGIGMTLQISIITYIMEAFLGLIAILFGIILLAGGFMIIKDE